jgi:hypothetical protein
MRPNRYDLLVTRVRAWLERRRGLAASARCRRIRPDRPGPATDPLPTPKPATTDAILLESFLVRPLRRDHEHATEQASTQLAYCRDGLAQAVSVTDDDDAHAEIRRELRELVADLDRIAMTIADGAAGFITLWELRCAIVRLRFIRPDHDVPDTDNPLYNVTIWALEALTACAEMVRTANY